MRCNHAAHRPVVEEELILSENPFPIVSSTSSVLLRTAIDIVDSMVDASESSREIGLAPISKPNPFSILGLLKPRKTCSSQRFCSGQKRRCVKVRMGHGHGHGNDVQHLTQAWESLALLLPGGHPKVSVHASSSPWSLTYHILVVTGEATKAST